MRSAVILAAALAAGLAACSDGGKIIDLDDSVGTVRGAAYIDQDADGALDTRFDLAAPGAIVALVLDGTNDTIARTQAGAGGAFTISNVPIGRYELRASRGTLGDSVAVLGIDDARFMLSVNDTIFRTVRLGFPVVSAAQLANTAAGRRVTVEGIALNSWGTFGDSTIHVWTGAGALVSVRVFPTVVAAGDSVRLVGTVGSTTGGKPAVADVIARVLSGARGLPPVDSLATAGAASADGGRLAFAQARIAGATITDTARVGNDRRITVNDGSGALDIILDQSIQFNPSLLVPGATVQAAGVLVPAANGTTWQLKPRTQADFTATFPTFTVAAARALASGSRVSVQGKLLNAWTTFGDSIVHIIDNTGAIRAIRVPATPAMAGDSVRILGSIGTSAGRTVITDAAVTILATARGLPAADSISTAALATADGGRLADSHARIAGTIVDTLRAPNGDLQVGVDDGSGRGVVTLSSRVSFEAGPYAVGAAFAVTGVLQPLPAGGWTLKPRERADALLTFPTVTTAEARTSNVGRRVIVEGIALTRWNAFGDSTVHLRDATGAIRGVRITGAAQAGDSIRVLGTIAIRNGARVVFNGSVTVLRAGVGTAEPDSIPAARAQSADGGVLDANQVRVGGTIIGARTETNGDRIITVADLNDANSRVDVVLDADINFGATSYVPGMNISVAGVLIPAANLQWQVYPRGAADITAVFPTVTIAAARALPLGRTVSISGIALTGWQTFGDGSVHVRDNTAAIRVIGLPSSPIFAGDSVKITGTLALREGQVTLTGSSSSVLLTGIGLPAIPTVSTSDATRALAPASDASQARVVGRVTSFQTTNTGEVQLAIDDGTGALPVLLDRDVGFGGGYNIGDVATVTGVLVPYGTGNLWQLKPRTLGEVAVVAGQDTVKSFRTTFREYVTGQTPGGWSPRWDRTVGFFVTDDQTATERKVLQWSGQNPLREQFALVYEAVQELPTQAVYTEFRVRTVAADTVDRRVGVAGVRIDGSTTDERGYGVYFVQNRDGGRRLVLGSVAAGNLTEIATVSFPWNEDVWYSVRIEANGSTIQAKAWRRGQAEPELFMVTGTGASQTGRPGVITQHAGTVQWDVFQVTTGN